MVRLARIPLASDQRVKYRVPHQRRGTRVAKSLTPLGPDYGVRLGFVVDHLGDTIHIDYDDDPDSTYLLNAVDAKYLVDRGLLRFTPPPRERRLRLGPNDVPCKFPGCDAKGKGRKKCPPDHRGPGAAKPETWGSSTEEGSDRALTPSSSSDKMTMSNQRGGMPLTEEQYDMATAEKISAKAAAIEIGTDARTLRKFLRSDSSTFEPCGQGNRYEFTKSQMKKLAKEFAAWGGGKSTPKKGTKQPVAQEPDDDDADIVEEDDIEVEDEESDDIPDTGEDEDWEEPDNEDLVDLDDIEIED